MDFDLNSPNLDGDYKAFKKIEVRNGAFVFTAAFSVIGVSRKAVSLTVARNLSWLGVALQLCTCA